ncbi:MAG: ABC transporter ATP-binding protein [Firmicutes bacterium]|nr:ABC transporter ATP-binding protein [Bacillota bacterium]
MAALLSVHDLCYTYHTPKADTPALADISFSVEKGEFVSIVGPSGCGKSTLLSLVAGLAIPDQGHITLHTQASHPVGYMFQRDHLLEWRSIFSNACLGLEIRGAMNDKNQENVRQMLRQYGLGDFMEHRPSQLSGGMRQRAALVRTLALQPELLLLDEPFSALDYQTRITVADEIWQILRQSGKTAVLVTHDISEAISLGDRVMVLSARPGRIMYDIRTDFGPDRTPLSVRSHPAFQTYFQQIWQAMVQMEGVDHHGKS